MVAGVAVFASPPRLPTPDQYLMTSMVSVVVEACPSQIGHGIGEDVERLLPLRQRKHRRIGVVERVGVVAIGAE